MKKYILNKQVFLIFLLILIAGFLVWPKIGLVQKIENINLKEIERYLEIPEDKVESLIHSLINLFNSKWIDLMASGFSAKEEKAVPNIMRGAVRTQALSHLLVDAPIETTWTILKAGIKIVKIYINPEITLEEFEKLTVEKAIEEGKRQLFQNEVRINPGVIDFKYISREGEEKIAPFQYIIIYKPSTSQKGEVLIRFYSPQPLEPPENKIIWESTWATNTELKHALPPFIVDIQGEMENYQWVGQPSMKIDFSDQVLDLGIKPLSFREKHVLKPLKTTIKEVETIITKMTGKGPKISEMAPEIWEKIKLTISKFISALLAALITVPEIPEIRKEQSLIVKETKEKDEMVEKGEVEIKSPSLPTPGAGEKERWAEIQERLDDIIEDIDVLKRQLAELAEEKRVKLVREEIDKEKKEEIEEESEELKELAEEKETEGKKVKEKKTKKKKKVYQSSGSPPPPPPSYPKILISEIQISPNEQRFIELYNPNDEEINLTNWYIQRKTKNATSWSSLVTKTNFENKVIQPHSYFLIAKLSNFNPNILLESLTLTEDNAIVLKNPKREEVDKVGWGNARDYETASTSNPEGGKSIGRKWSTTTENYIDTDNNQNDFEIQTPTPGNQNQSLPKWEEESPPSLIVVINEIAWMGTATSSWDEWIELFNNTTSSIDLAGWKVKKGNEDFAIISNSTAATTTIPAGGFYLLERNEKAVSDITADFVYGGGELMKNNPNCEILSLYDSNNKLIDQTVCLENGDWPAGQASPNYISMERISAITTGTTSTNWADNNLITRNGLDAAGNNINGTPKAENSVSKTETIVDIQNFNNLFNVDNFSQITFTRLGNPYIISNYLAVPQNKTLIIEPDVTLKFESEAGLNVNGTLKAIGQADKKIIFTSSAEPNYWAGIHFNFSSTNSELIWTEIRYGKKGEGEPLVILVDNSSIVLANSTLENYNDRGLKLINSNSTIENTNFLGSGTTTSIVGIEIKGGSPTIKNSEIKNNKHGIFIASLTEGDLPIIEGNNFEGNEYPIYLTYNSALFPIFRNNQGSGNQKNVISIRGRISKDAIWEKNALPYFIEDFIEVSENTTTTIKPGVITYFNSKASFNIKGTLLARGTQTENIIFTAYPSQAPWGRIYFTPSSTNSILENVIVSQGGGYNTVSQIYLEGSSILLNNSTSTNSEGAGIYLENSSSAISNSHFGHSQFGIKIYGSDRFPQLGNGITFENNSIYDIYIDMTQWCPLLPDYLKDKSNCPQNG